MLNKEALLLTGGSTYLTVIVRKDTSIEEESAIAIDFSNGKETFRLANDNLNWTQKMFKISFGTSHVEAYPVDPSRIAYWTVEPEMNIFAEGSGEFYYDNAKPGMKFIFTAGY